MFNCVSNVGRRTLDSCLSQRSIEQFSGGPDKGTAGKILIVPRLLPHQNQTRRTRALSENSLRCTVIKVASTATLYCLSHFRQRGMLRDKIFSSDEFHISDALQL